MNAIRTLTPITIRAGRQGRVPLEAGRAVTDPAQVQPTLDRMVGLDEPGKVRLRCANLVSPALFAAGQSREDRISAVHYVRFPVGDEGRTALRHTGSAELEVDHGGYTARAALSPETVEELREDLA